MVEILWRCFVAYSGHLQLGVQLFVERLMVERHGVERQYVESYLVEFMFCKKVLNVYCVTIKIHLYNIPL